MKPENNHLIKIYWTFLFLLFNQIIASEIVSAHTNQYTVPPKIQIFLDKHFSKYEIEKLKYDAKDGECKVKYKNGIKIEFNHNGDWEQIESEYAPLPKSIIDILPAPAIAFIAGKYPHKHIIKIKHQSREYKVKLEDSLELKFDLQGHLIKTKD